MVHVNERGCPKNHHCPAMRVCPANAIVQESPFHAPKVIHEKCTGCQRCVLACGVFEWREAGKAGA